MSKATPSTELPRRSMLLLAAAATARASLGCVPAEPAQPPQPPPPEPTTPPVVFGYPTADGGTLTSEELLGRLTVIALIATYDFTSQAQLKVLTLLQRDHTPRVNVAAIALEPPENQPLVAAFVQSLGLKFEVALGDDRAIAGRHPFPGLRQVPSVVILDRRGREVFRHVGPMDLKPLGAELDRLDARR